MSDRYIFKQQRPRQFKDTNFAIIDNDTKVLFENQVIEIEKI